MKKKLNSGLFILAVMAAVAPADSLRGGLSMEFVAIGHAGNAPHVYTYGSAYSRGAVDHNYEIGTFEVTAGQWGVFTNLASLHPSPERDLGQFDDESWEGGSKPVVQVTWYEAAQFCNWLTSGDTRKGVYQFDSDSGALSGIDRAGALTEYGRVYALPTIDEWYKAAYFKSDGSGYSVYANGTSVAPEKGVDSNYLGLDLVLPVWDVGSGAEEQNGTFDMMGNIWEWMEAPVDGTINSESESMGLIGGAAHWVDEVRIQSGTGYIKTQNADDAQSWTGFRVVAIPEPAALSLILGSGGISLLLKRARDNRSSGMDDTL